MAKKYLATHKRSGFQIEVDEQGRQDMLTKDFLRGKYRFKEIEGTTSLDAIKTDSSVDTTEKVDDPLNNIPSAGKGKDKGKGKLDK